MTARQLMKSLEFVMTSLCIRMMQAQQLMYDELLAQVVSLKELSWAKAVLAAGELNKTVKLLQAERLRQKMSLVELEKATGISRSTWSEIETQKRGNPSIASLEKFAAALGVKLVVAMVLEDDSQEQVPQVVAGTTIEAP